ncbi:MAG: PIN domain-containing protein [Candidatus Baldrarchaeia archaeon]
MKLLLDTTYFLPAIGISVKEIPRNLVIELIRRGYEVLMSEISIFELSAKGAKYVVSGALTPVKVSRGIKALVYDERVRKIPIHEPSILLTAIDLRKLLRDFIDSLILSSAINRADILVTEDEDIHKVSGKRNFHKIVENINPRFEVKSIKEIL